MRRLIKIIAAGILPLSVLCSTANAEVTLVPAQTVERCFEDQPCWDCETMGNKICGLTPSENEAELRESTRFNGTTELPETL